MRNLKLAKILLSAFLCIGSIAFADHSKAHTEFEIVKAFPEFMPDADAEPIDPTFRADVEKLSSFYGLPAQVTNFYHKDIDLLGQDNVLLKIFAPAAYMKAKGKELFYQGRFIVEVPALCQLGKSFSGSNLGITYDNLCSDQEAPNGVLQFINVDEEGRVGIIRFPSEPLVTGYLKIEC